MRKLYATLTTAGLLMGLAMGCGDDGGGGDDGGDIPGEGGEGGERPSGGTSAGGSSARAGRPGNGGSGATGGSSQQVGGQPSDGGEPAVGGMGGEGGTDGTPSIAGIDDVVSEVCEWEFRCCDEGERAYRLSPFADDAADCATRLIYEMRQSNATANPYKSGPAASGGILGILGYTVDLSRVEVNPAGAAQCVAAWRARGCNEQPDAGVRCDGPGEPDPCALTNLFRPKLAIGDECTEELAETGAWNDVECETGSTCLPAEHPDNPKDVPICVKRGLEGQPCTADDDCDFDFYCSDGDCAEKGDAGDSCSFEDPEEPVPGEEEEQCKAGLSCHPTELECVESCTLGATCAADASCPAGSGCAPLEVGESTDVFSVCTELGKSAAASCNTDGDCTAAYYCDGAKCQADKQASQACAAANQCAEGLHCDLTTTGTCVTNIAAGAACTQKEQCGPSSAGCLNAGSRGFLCRKDLQRSGETCGDDTACASGRCEYASTTATERTCVSGAKEGDECDTALADGTALRCAPGLHCLGMNTAAAAGGECVAQVDAGGDCTNEDGEPMNELCANQSMCADAWDQGNVCTDAAVPEQNGGTGLTCDGA